MSRLSRTLRLLRLLAVVTLVFAVPVGAAWLEWRFDRGASYTQASGDQRVTFTPHWRFSPELRALRSLDEAQDMEIVSLQPWMDWAPESGARAADARCGGHCIDGNRVLGRVPVAPEDRAAIVAALSGWMRAEPSVLSMCEPEFRHAVAWQADGKRYEVLLCYSCGIYALRVDGKAPALAPYGQGAHVQGDDLMNARFRGADIRHYENATESWVSGPARFDGAVESMQAAR